MIERRGEHGCQGPAEGQRTNEDEKTEINKPKSWRFKMCPRRFNETCELK